MVAESAMSEEKRRALESAKASRLDIPAQGPNAQKAATPMLAGNGSTRPRAEARRKPLQRREST
jgi:hypothetical protein